MITMLVWCCFSFRRCFRPIKLHLLCLAGLALVSLKSKKNQVRFFLNQVENIFAFHGVELCQSRWSKLRICKSKSWHGNQNRVSALKIYFVLKKPHHLSFELTILAISKKKIEYRNNFNGASKFVITLKTWELLYALSWKRTDGNAYCWKSKQSTL